MSKLRSLYNIALLGFAASVLTAASCKSNNDDSDVRQPYVIPDSLFHTLVIDTVKMSNVTNAIKFNGIVDFNADKVVNVFPLISGNVQDVHVKIGDYVTQGQVLGIVKSAEIANYNSALITAAANVQLTAKQLAQQKDLFKSGLASQVDVTGAQVAYEQAVAAKTAAERVLNINGSSTNGDYIIKSPISGFVVQKNLTDGMSIRPDNNAALYTISNLKDVWVEANVYEENIGKVHLGDPADVTTISYPDSVFKGKVSQLMNVLDPTTKVMKMRVVLNNPNYVLKPEMFATVVINDNEHKQAISISGKDLVFSNSQYYVIVITGKKDVAIRPVDIISINGPVAYIQGGVKPGERLIGSQAILIFGSLNN